MNIGCVITKEYINIKEQVRKHIKENVLLNEGDS